MDLASADEPIDNWAADRERTAAWRAERLEDLLALSPPDGAPGDEPEQSWEITDDGAASWALRKISAENRELQRLASAFEYEQAELRRWQDEASRPRASTVQFFTSKLVDYRRRLEIDDADLPKTYRLPTGDLTRRAGRTSATLVDSNAYVAWCSEHAPEALSVKPLTSPVTKSDRFTTTDEGAVVDSTTGEIVPGIAVVKGSDVYGVVAR